MIQKDCVVLQIDFIHYIYLIPNLEKNSDIKYIYAFYGEYDLRYGISLFQSTLSMLIKKLLTLIFVRSGHKS